MITFRDQIILIIYFLIFGMFLSAMFDILHYFLRKFKLKLIVSYLIEIIFWMGLVVIACLYMLRVSEGYLTIYTFGFFFLGVVIYGCLLRESFKKDLHQFVVFVGRVFNKSKKTLIIIIYPKEVVTFIKLLFKKLNSLIIKVFLKIMLLFKRKKRRDEKNEEINNLDSINSINNNNEWL